MSRSKIVVLSALLTLAGSSAFASPPPSTPPAGGRAAAPALERLQGRGIWEALRCGACIGGLAGVSIYEPGIPYLFDDTGNIYGACMGACTGILG